jgi:hypothetical protein
MTGIICSMVGASFVTAAAEVRPAMYVVAENNAQISTAQSKFGGASVLFDGVNDMISANALDTDLLAGNFTFECWFRANNVSGIKIILSLGREQPGRVLLYLNGSTLLFDSYGAETPDITCSGTIAANTWYHVAAVRSGSTITIYRDGSSVGSGSRSGTVGNRFGIVAGADGNYGNGMNGYIDEIRVSKIARYTSSFTPSSTAFVNDNDTILLLHCNGTNGSTTFTDDSANAWVAKTMVAIGNAQVSTSQKQFGTGSAYNGAVLGADLAYGGLTGNVTLECWVRFTSGNTTNKGILAFGNEFFGRFVIFTDASSQLRTDTYSTGFGNIATGFTVSADTWYHIAYVRNSATGTFYVNGVSRGTSGNASSTAFGNTGFWSFCDTGIFVDEVRISNIARYTSGFTPATSEFGSGDGNTLRLYHCNGDNGSTSFPDAS